MPINRWKDRENVVHWHNGVLNKVLKYWNHKISNKMARSKKTHPAWSNLDSKTNMVCIHYMWVFNVKFLISRLQSE